MRISGTALASWYEIQLPLKWDDLATQSAVIGWKRKDDGAVPELRIDLPASVAQTKQLSFTAAMSEESPLEEDSTEEWKQPDSIDFQIVLTGQIALAAGDFML